MIYPQFASFKQCDTTVDVIDFFSSNSAHALARLSFTPTPGTPTLAARPILAAFEPRLFTCKTVDKPLFTMGNGVIIYSCLYVHIMYIMRVCIDVYFTPLYFMVCRWSFIANSRRAHSNGSPTIALISFIEDDTPQKNIRSVLRLYKQMWPLWFVEGPLSLWYIHPTRIIDYSICYCRRSPII